MGQFAHLGSIEDFFPLSKRRVGETHVFLMMKNQWFVQPAWVSPTLKNYKPWDAARRASKL
jgi:hypothetical protein